MKKWKYKTPGIPDDLFVRGNVPMSKEEVRAVIISKLRLNIEDIIYDIGAGTGSISIEAALQAEEGKIYAVERKHEGIELIRRNAANFELNNIEVISGQAPDVLEDLPAPDRVVIGGSGGYLQQILELIDSKIKDEGRIVVTAVTTKTLNAAITNLEKLDYRLDICNIAVTRTRKAADYHMFNGLNPVYIISADK